MEVITLETNKKVPWESNTGITQHGNNTTRKSCRKEEPLYNDQTQTIKHCEVEEHNQYGVSTALIFVLVQMY